MNGKAQIIETTADIERGLAHLSQICPTLKRIIAQTPDVPLRRTNPGFASLASIIISQQVSKQSADAIFGRMENLVQPLTAKQYMECGEAIWIEIGLSRPKQRTFNALCEAIKSGTLNLDALSSMPANNAMHTMTAIKGIGPWTAEVYLLFAVGHRDIFPAGDLALQQAIADAYDLDERPSEKQARQRAESWAPWRGVAARLFWAYYATVKGRAVAP